MESIAKVRRERHLSRNTVRKIVRHGETQFEYQRTSPQPKLGEYTDQLN